MSTPFERSYWIVPGKFMAGCYPGDQNADKAAAKLEGMVEAGIRHVVNLMEEREFGHQGVPFAPYKAAFSARGINCVRMPIKDMHTPSAEEMVAILDNIDEAIAAGAPTYVHCWGGKGRTGTVVGCWMVRHAMVQPERAVDRIKDLQALCGGKLQPSPENPTQVRFLEGWKRGQ